MTTVLLDCDDVLLDWLGGFADFAAERLNRPIEHDPHDWDMSEWLGVNVDVVCELISEFNASPAFGDLKAVDGSRDVIHTMLSDGCRLHVITSCSSARSTVEMRRANLEREFGVGTFDSIHCLDLGQSKQTILQAWKPGALWIEDNYKNALMGLEAGHDVLIRERAHNKQYQELHEDRVGWFSEWKEMLP